MLISILCPFYGLLQNQRTCLDFPQGWSQCVGESMPWETLNPWGMGSMLHLQENNLESILTSSQEAPIGMKSTLPTALTLSILPHMDTPISLPPSLLPPEITSLINCLHTLLVSSSALGIIQNRCIMCKVSGGHSGAALARANVNEFRTLERGWGLRNRFGNHLHGQGN